jgi:hypothetical protein
MAYTTETGTMPILTDGWPAWRRIAIATVLAFDGFYAQSAHAQDAC